MSTRDTKQSLSVTRGPATSTVTVDYGSAPPRITAELRMVDGAGALQWHRSAEILPAKNGEPARWGDSTCEGEMIRTRPDYANTADYEAFKLAKRRWRVFYRRITSIALERGGPRLDRNNRRIKGR